LVERDLAFNASGRAGAVVLQEGVAVRAVGEWYVEDLCVLERLLHAVADGMGVVLGFDHSDRQARLEVEDVVGLLCFATLDRLAADDGAALGEVEPLAQLRHHVPLAPVGTNERGRDELGADIRLGEPLLVHAASLVAENGRRRCVIERPARSGNRRAAHANVRIHVSSLAGQLPRSGSCGSRPRPTAWTTSSRWRARSRPRRRAPPQSEMFKGGLARTTSA